MKNLAVLVTIFVVAVVSCIECFQIYVDDLDRQYCGLEYPEEFRYCMIENGAGIAIKLYRNCAQQVKFFETLDELTNFTCKSRSEKEYQDYLKCFIPAMKAEAEADPKFLEIALKCITKAENHK